MLFWLFLYLSTASALKGFTEFVLVDILRGSQWITTDTRWLRAVCALASIPLATLLETYITAIRIRRVQ
jgi:hypothetical protein